MKRVSKENKQPSAFLRPFGFVLATLSFGLSFLSMKPLGFGFWYQTEPVISATWTLGALSAIWLFFRSRVEKEAILKDFQSPVVWTLLLVAGVSAVMSLFHPVPLQSWSGTPQLGEGIMTFFSQALIAMVFVSLLEEERTKRALIWMGLFVGSVIAGFTLAGSSESPIMSLRYWDWAPYFFPACMGFIALAFAAMYGAYHESLKEEGRTSFLHHVLFPPLILGIAYYSHNKSLMYGVFISGALLLGLRFVFKKTEQVRARLMPACFLVIIGFIFVVTLTGRLGDWVPTSVESRGVMLQYVLLPIYKATHFQDFRDFFVGRGWGSYIEYVTSNLFISSEGALFTGDTWKPTDEAVHRDQFHSHNSAIEFYGSLGVIGFALYFFINTYLIRSLKPRFTYIGGFYLLTLYLLTSFWFQMTATVPFMLFSLALICGRTSFEGAWWPVWSARLMRHMQPVCASVAACLLLFTLPFTVISYRIGKTTPFLSHQSMKMKIYSITKDPWIRYDEYYGAKRLAPSVSNHARVFQQMMDKIDNIDIEAAAKFNLEYAEFLVSKGLGGANLQAYITPLNIFGDLATHEKTARFVETHPDIVKIWDDSVREFVAAAPRRADMAVGLMGFYLRTGAYQKAQSMVDFLLAQNGACPIGLWYGGNIKLARGQGEIDGLKMMKRSINNGVGRFIPISKEMQEQAQMIPD